MECYLFNDLLVVADILSTALGGRSLQYHDSMALRAKTDSSAYGVKTALKSNAHDVDSDVSPLTQGSHNGQTPDTPSSPFPSGKKLNRQASFNEDKTHLWAGVALVQGIEDMQIVQNALRVSTAEKTFTLRFPSAEDKVLWLEDLQKAVGEVDIISARVVNSQTRHGKNNSRYTVYIIEVLHLFFPVCAIFRSELCNFGESVPCHLFCHFTSSDFTSSVASLRLTSFS